ncbi:calcium channel protein [Basidiobolus ranarum]|uniref:Calcium channel protein n=1 Tax=Basidiobolus ranarum TaxID=34480 RepID=A0ABR2VMY6_9FUNG
MDIEETSLSENCSSTKLPKTSQTTFQKHSVRSAIQRASARIINLSTTRFDNPSSAPVSLENSNPESDERKSDDEFYSQPHRLSGRSLYIFSSNNSLRIALAKLFNKRWMGLLITLLIVHHWLLLCVQFWDAGVRDYTFGASWTDYPLFVIFVFYTLEMIARIIISGFIINPSGLQPRHPRVDIMKKSQFLVVDVHSELDSLFPDRAYLRHSFQRIDFVVVVSFWINLVLLFTGHGRFTVFSALSALRPFRLISMTSGSWTILRSLKKSAPVLANVTLFLLCFFLLFGIIGVISFEGSFDRRCVAADIPSNPETVEQYFTIPERYCGHYDDFTKGYACPPNFKCMNIGSPFEGTLGYNNIFQAVPILFGITAAQGWLVLMFQTMDAEYSLPSALYYIIGVVVFNFWLLNLFVAVITEMFAKIREDTNHSAFISSRSTIVLNDGTEDDGLQGQNKVKLKQSFLEKNFEVTYYFWILLVAADLVIMCVRSYDPDDEDNAASSDPTMIQGDFLIAERIFTAFFAIEIILRYFATPKSERRTKFFSSKRNRLDLFLAVINCIIQIPPIPTVSSGMLYRYLTVFQVARFYRIVMAIPRLRKLIVCILGTIWPTDLQ